MGQREIYLRLYELYNTIIDKGDGRFQGLSPVEFNIVFNEVKEFNSLLEKFRPNMLKFNPVREKEIKQRINYWYEDGPTFLSLLLREKFRPIYQKSKRVLYNIAKQFVVKTTEYRKGALDPEKAIPKNLDKIFNGLTSESPEDGYTVIGKQYLEKFATGNITPPMLQKLWNRYVYTDILEAEAVTLNEAKRGFWNPEEDEDFMRSKTKVRIDLEGELKKANLRNDFRRIEAWSPYRGVNKVDYRNGKIVATTKFFPGDVIEKDPIKPVGKEELAFKSIRDMAFQVIPGKLWGIPVGYSGLYRRSDEVNKDANAVYSYDESKNAIVIKAIAEINKNEEIILRRSDIDTFGNLYKKN